MTPEIEAFEAILQNQTLSDDARRYGHFALQSFDNWQHSVGEEQRQSCKDSVAHWLTKFEQACAAHG